MKTFIVGIWKEVGGYVNIEATSSDEAIDKAQAILNEHGLDGFPDLDVTHGDHEIIDCEELQP